MKKITINGVELDVKVEFDADKVFVDEAIDITEDELNEVVERLHTGSNPYEHTFTFDFSRDYLGDWLSQNYGHHPGRKFVEAEVIEPKELPDGTNKAS